MTGRPRRIAMITGAGRNIGRAIALDLASRVDIVVVVRRNREEAGVAGEVRALGRRAMVGVTDVRDEEAISGVVERAREELDRSTCGQQRGGAPRGSVPGVAGGGVA